MQKEFGSAGFPGTRPFGRFERRRETLAGGWTPVDLGGHEVVARLELELPPGPEAARRARGYLDRLRGHIQESALDVARLLVTELVTNSVRHGRRGDADPVELEVDLYANALRVEVRDTGPGFELDARPTPHPDRPGGWGLCLVDRLADRWGVERRDRTLVWFEIERAGDRWEVVV